MRLKAAVGGVLCSTIALCSAAFAQDVAIGVLQRRHIRPALHADLIYKRDVSLSQTVTPTPTSSSTSVDVFGVTAWPTISIPAGYTLAGGVEITPMPVVAMSSVTGTAAFSSAVSQATEVADPATWNQQVDAACQQAMNSLDGQADNPSGMVACYNIAYLSTTQGRFEADLRIFNVSAPTGDFVGVTEADMLVTLAYPDAQLTSNTSGSMQFPVKREVYVEKRQTKSSNGVYIPTEVMSQKYMVQLNSGAFTSGMNQSVL
jgi:hypothetical protein